MAKRKKKDLIDPIKLAEIKAANYAERSDNIDHLDMPVTQAQIDQFMKEARWDKYQQQPVDSPTVKKIDFPST